jgi:crossover junction endodeoxyribonuclease RuvC
MIYLGIDPGLSGGLAWMKMGELIETRFMPTADKFLDLRVLDIQLKRHHIEKAFLEKVAAMPGQGVSSMFKFGRTYGAIEALLVANCIPYELIPPQRWTRSIHAGLEPLCLNPTSKEKSALAASMLFKCYDFRKSKRARNPHDGMVDAALICEYGRCHAPKTQEDSK